MQLKLLGLASLLASLLATSSIAASINSYDVQKPISDSKTDFHFKKLRKSLKKADIIDGVVDDFAPRCYILPYYSNGKKARTVALGNKFKKSVTKAQPGLKIYCQDLAFTGLTVALTDPDAPSHKNPKWSEMCHWIATIHPSPETISDSNTLDLEPTGAGIVDLVEYKAPGPPAKTGYHRYVFVLLAGDNTNLTAPSERQHWGTNKTEHGVRDWAKEEGLEVIGANWFIEKNKKQ
jgi:phosphatidylethanolamine-binding protein (PEBP) family uncharacterized protein